MYVGIDDLRMRIYLQHRLYFRLPAIGVKLFIYKMFGGPYCTCFSFDHYRILQAYWVWIRTTNVPNSSQIGRQISELLRVKILDILHHLWTAYLSQIRPSPIGNKT